MVKCAVVHSDGGLVTEIIVDTYYLSSVNLSYVWTRWFQKPEKIPEPA